MDYYLAIDIGASSGRHMLGHIENGKLQYEEIHRFPNGMVTKDKQLCWDLDELFAQILTGLRRCKELDKVPVSVGIDTWGVDFVLLDQCGGILGNAVAYRDSRTAGCDEEVYKCISENELYRRTGIQKQLFNTVYQLMAVKNNSEQLLEKTKTMLLIPDYFHYRLCGVAKTEYTNATTTGLVNTATKNWDETIITACGYPKNIFAEIVAAGTVLGELTDEMQQQIGFNCKVVVPATHDTGSAVMSVPSVEENTLYISSGTWSLMGVERASSDCSEKSQRLNFTNEGGFNHRFRYLKSIMGLWIIQELKRGLDNKYSFGELCSLAELEGIDSIVNCNDNRFLSPKNMIDEIRSTCIESGQQEPINAGELAAVIYNSLASCYAATVKELEASTAITYPSIYIVGGGSNAAYLNQLTANYTGKTVYAGPSEATAIGNLMAQMITDGLFADLYTARECVKQSFEIRRFQPCS